MARGRAGMQGPEIRLTPFPPPANHAPTPRRSAGDVLQGAAADCNSAGETHAWFDSRVAHHFFRYRVREGWLHLMRRKNAPQNAVCSLFEPVPSWGAFGSWADPGPAASRPKAPPCPPVAAHPMSGHGGPAVPCAGVSGAPQITAASVSAMRYHGIGGQAASHLQEQLGRLGAGGIISRNANDPRHAIR